MCRPSVTPLLRLGHVWFSKQLVYSRGGWEREKHRPLDMLCIQPLSLYY